MALLPAKLRHGDQLRSVTVDTLNTLIDYIYSQRLINGDGIKLQHLASGTIISAIQEHSAFRTDTSVFSANTTTYDGFFTLKDVSRRNQSGKLQELRVAVCDGATWDSGKEQSGASEMQINFVSFKVPSTILSADAILDDDRGRELFIHLRYDTSQGWPYTPFLSIDEINSTSIQEQTGEQYLLGSVAYDRRSDRLIIRQRHQVGIGNGIPRLWHLTKVCNG